jgi:branched-chain amino acid transport system substrate-binding protein
MNRKVLYVATICTVLVMVCVVLVVKRGRGTVTDVQRIGVVFPLTGDASSYGQKGRRAIEMAVDDFNAHQEAGAIKVSAVFEDSKGDARDGVLAAQKLMSADKTPAIVGDALSAVTLPIAPVCESNHVVLMSPCSSAPALTGAGRYIFRIWPSDLEEGKAAAGYAWSHGYRSVAILHLNNDYGNGIAQIFTSIFEADGGKVLMNSAYQDNTGDWRTVVTPAVSNHPDVVYVAGYYQDTAAILRMARGLGLKVQFIGATAIEDPNFLKLAGPEAEGIVYPLATGYDASSSDPTTKDFVQSFEKRYGYEPGWMEAHAYDAFMLVAGPLRGSRSLITGEGIRVYLDQLGTYHGVTGDIRFNKNGDVIRPLFYKTVKNGAFIRLEGQQ